MGLSERMLDCPKCKTKLPSDWCNAPVLAGCPQCQTELQVFAFPALIRGGAEQGNAGEVITTEGEAGCFFHPGKRAAVSCEGCGRFLCALCDIDLNGQHLCATCLESGKSKGRIKALQDRRVLHDNVVMSLALVPVVFSPIMVITAPMTIFLAIRHWNSPRSLLPRQYKLRLVLAMVIAVLEIVGWSTVIYFMVTRR